MATDSGVEITRNGGATLCGKYVTTSTAKDSNSPVITTEPKFTLASDIDFQLTLSVTAAQSDPHYAADRKTPVYPDAKKVLSWQGLYLPEPLGERRTLATLKYTTPAIDTAAPSIASATTTPDTNRRYIGTATGSDNTWIQTYEWYWNQAPTALTGTKQTTTPYGSTYKTSSITGPSLTPGIWYLHVVAVDAAGNRSAPKVATINVILDSAKPTVTEVNTTRNTLSSFSGTAFATDNVQVKGYRWVWNASATSTAGTSVTTTSGILDATALTTGTWYLHVSAFDVSGNQSDWKTSAAVTSNPISSRGRCSVWVSFTGDLVVVDRSASYADCGNYVTMTVKVRDTSEAGFRSASSTTFAPHVAIAARSRFNNGGPTYGEVQVIVSAGQSDPHYADSGTILLYPDMKTVATWTGYYGYSYGEFGRFGYDTPPKDVAAPTLTSASVTPDIDRRFNAVANGADNVWVETYEWIWNQSPTSLSGGTKQATHPRGFDSGKSSQPGPSLNYGTWYLHVVAVDASGNRSNQKVVSIQVNRDTGIPTVTSFSVKRDSLRYYSATASATDNIGVIKYRWIWNNSPTATTGAATDTTAGVLPSRKLSPGTWYLHATAIDSVGNLSAWRTSAAFVVPEETAPSISTPRTSTRFTNSPFQTWTDATVSALDASGIAKYEWVWNQSETDTATGVKSTTTTGILPSQHLVSSVPDCKKQWNTGSKYYVHVRATDKYGNASSWVSSPQEIDRPPCFYGVYAVSSGVGSDGAFLFDGGSRTTAVRISSNDSSWGLITVGYCYSWTKPAYGVHNCPYGHGRTATTPETTGSNEQFMFDWSGYLYRGTSVELPTNDTYKLWICAQDENGRNTDWTLVTQDLVKNWAWSDRPY